MAQVHVHLAEAGAAVEAGLGTGRLSQIRITALPPEAPGRRAATRARAWWPAPDWPTPSRPWAARRCWPPDRVQTLVGELTAAAEQTCGDLVILPNDMETLEIARHLATALRRHGRRVAVIPTVAQVQGLAALAVHEPSADFDSVVVAMSSAAGHARHGAVTVAESPAMTMAGRCEVGDVLGLVDGDFVEIGDDARRGRLAGGRAAARRPAASCSPWSPGPTRTTAWWPGLAAPGPGRVARARRRGGGRRTAPLPAAAGPGMTTLRLGPARPWRTDTFRRLGDAAGERSSAPRRPSRSSR